MTIKKWFKEYWDDVLFVGLILAGIYFMLKAMGKI